MDKILITPRSLTREEHPALGILKKAGYETICATPGQQPDETELLRLLPGCVGMLAGVEKITAKVLEAATDLRAISRNGTGIDNIDLEAAERLGIKILRAEGANARGVAELAIGLMFALTRAIPYSSSTLKTGAWDRKKGIELDGKTLGLIGCGKIGKLVAQMAIGLGMQVIAYDLYPDATFNPAPVFRFVPFKEALQAADVVSLHCPPTADGRPLINKETMTLLKQGVYLVNTARAGLIDEETVLGALHSGQIAGLATDVFDQEPPEISELFAHDNVIVTPHIGGFTNESVANAARVACENLVAYLTKG